MMERPGSDNEVSEPGDAPGKETKQQGKRRQESAESIFPSPLPNLPMLVINRRVIAGILHFRLLQYFREALLCPA